MKKAFSSLLCGVLFFAMTPVTAAQENHVQKELIPEKNSEVILEKVVFAKEGDREEITIRDTEKVDDQQTAYHMEINREKGTYRTTKKKPLTVNEDNKKVTPHATYYYGWVKAVTDDPPGADLAATTLRLDWVDYGSTIAPTDHSMKRWAANPSTFGTHWYKDWSNLHNPERYDNNRKIRLICNANYYNYDFGDDSKRTDSKHYIRMDAKNNATYSYEVTMTPSGEFSSLLDLDVYTN
ncbi:hypothetical protein [Melghirimyces algeriensis]|uniref:Uncharacterized protein n=1 Tax=Melghirimyces algeriensis TaxID=910412 RepID=A0A521BCK8_9BACL|nr:hypothetical protein [Melghirimyces algeriensis]SMO44844.1 hypothetical protein SAMN06264849_1022 [Melghirimyces algeriensis]